MSTEKGRGRVNLLSLSLMFALSLHPLPFVHVHSLTRSVHGGKLDFNCQRYEMLCKYLPQKLLHARSVRLSRVSPHLNSRVCLLFDPNFASSAVSPHSNFPSDSSKLILSRTNKRQREEEEDHGSERAREN
jgi:hypothetical protein